MSKRGDITTGRLIYTCNCGWMDLGHMRSSETRPHGSARYLWEDVLHERGLTMPVYPGSHVIGYRQSMTRFGITSEHFKAYWIKKGLTVARRQAVALSVFMEVTHGFESLQQKYSLITDSGYSEEDLVSNLVGFYSVVMGLNWAATCKPVSKEASFAIWDMHGSVGSRKNRSFKPNFYPCKECKDTHGIETPSFPAIFNVIQPARKEIDFGDVGKNTLVPRQLQTALYRHL
ncbi:hypothetical protein [Noviherbaspirillum saxi]|uniref:Uncharacterized protein n=1 Tax=Noviherbaspirillum saxi TaxID=2320863 RepID=A0A3A3FMB6_9BURK|nr:hypothetical protein [Noviherbaspirillum saxi]RJF97322.1 hypothetical protein D3871_01320 [Noviherbaspirillum saxi]